MNKVPDHARVTALALLIPDEAEAQIRALLLFEQNLGHHSLVLVIQ
jgi:hypothetical protein